MKPILILYATREGQTRLIAEHLAKRFRSRGLSTDVHDVRTTPTTLDLAGYSTAILAASVHMGKHEPEMIAFAKRHRAALSQMPNAFLSVSGAEATVEDASASADLRTRSAQEVQTALGRFVEQTGWQPARVQPVAGAMRYSKYNFFLRFVMKRIAKRKGGRVDTSADVEYTDWAALDRFARELIPERADALGPTPLSP